MCEDGLLCWIRNSCDILCANGSYLLHWSKCGRSGKFRCRKNNISLRLIYFDSTCKMFISNSFVQNDKLVRVLYEFKWYLLPTSDQKNVMHMILRMQNGIKLTIGPFQELNYKALKIVRKCFNFNCFFFGSFFIFHLNDLFLMISAQPTNLYFFDVFTTIRRIMMFSRLPIDFKSSIVFQSIVLFSQRIVTTDSTGETSRVPTS